MTTKDKDLTTGKTHWHHWDNWYQFMQNQILPEFFETICILKVKPKTV